MGTLYTSGSWRVKPGREDDFVAAWQEIAAWTAAEMPGAMWATLLRDQDDPSHFVSFGPWESEDAIDAWRASDGFRERVARIRELLESFEPMTGEAVADVS
jgi:heme-degrading monooxygenase HmoA